ncbi:ABC transporter permease [Rathayibacter sp. YIM 133350]|uniref:ABC transporter permease n=1 Tax=Rathayibacter sp. YIM 133350 TaxID=3131992 RepID=UPI00307CDF73
MFFTYLRRELAGRRRQTAIIATGMALAIALVIIVNSVSAGVRAAQATVLESVYGVGTDITVSQAATPPSSDGSAAPRQRFQFGSGDGQTSDGTTTVSQSRLIAGPGTTTFDASALKDVTGVENVKAASATLSLRNVSFNGQLPQFNRSQGDTTQGAQPPADQSAPQGGADGAGGSAFDVDSFTVLGLDPSADAIGPLSSVSVKDGRTLKASDDGTAVAVLDADYATSASLATGGTIDIGGTTFTIVGTVTSNTADGQSASNVYIPLDEAQTLSTETGKVSTIYVQADSSTDIAQIQKDIEKALPDATVSTQADLASSVSGSLATASSLIAGLGLWLSIAVLVAAFLLAILFTISGVTRRTREFGTLKAIGWSNGRVVGQVAGESVVQGLIGGALGIVIGLVGVLVINLIQPTLTGGTARGFFAGSAGSNAGTGNAAPGAGTGEFAGRGFGQAARAASSATQNVVLNAPVTVSVILIAVALAVVGGLVAGAFGGWRASRLRPAEALRSVG